MITTISTKINSIAQDFRNKLEKLPLKDVATILGTLNALAYCGGLNARTISRDKNRKLLFHRSNIDPLLVGRTVICGIKFISDYLKTHWSSYTHTDRREIFRIRALLCEHFQLFTLEDRQHWVEPKNRGPYPNPCGHFDIPGALLLAEQCEEILKQHYVLEEMELDWSEEIGNGNYPMVRDEKVSLPEHKWYTLKKLHDMVFAGTGISYCRKEPKIDPSAVANELMAEWVETRYLALAAGDRFDCALDALENGETDTAEFFEPVAIEPACEAVSVFVDRTGVEHFRKIKVAIAQDVEPTRISIASSLIQCCMRVPAMKHVKKEKMLAVPTWAILSEGFANEQTERAIAWWEEQIENSELWVSQIAPSWVWDAVLPF